MEAEGEGSLLFKFGRVNVDYFLELVVHAFAPDLALLAPLGTGSLHPCLFSCCSRGIFLRCPLSLHISLGGVSFIASLVRRVGYGYSIAVLKSSGLSVATVVLQDLAKSPSEESGNFAEIFILLVAHLSNPGYDFELVCIFLLMFFHQAILLYQASGAVLDLLPSLSDPSLRLLEKLIVFEGNLSECALDPGPVLACLQGVVIQFSGEAGVIPCASLEFLIPKVFFNFLEIVSSSQILVLQFYRLLLPLRIFITHLTHRTSPQTLHKLLHRNEGFQILHRLQQILEPLVMAARPQLQSFFHFGEVGLDLVFGLRGERVGCVLAGEREVDEIIEFLDQVIQFSIFHCYYIMSVELLTECKRKLLSSINRIDKILEVYDSTPLEKCLYETVKAETVIKESREVVGKHRGEYQRSCAKLREINERFAAGLAG